MTMFLTVAAVWIVSLVLFAGFVFVAPEGYEDDWFHYGRKK